MKLPTCKEIRCIVSQSRNKSTPGPNGIPFLLYKKCPKVLKWLHANLKQAGKNFHISNQWMIADGVYIPKEKNLKVTGYFCPTLSPQCRRKDIFHCFGIKINQIPSH